MEKKLFSKIAQAFGWLALTGVIASVGFLSDNPEVMVPTYALLFILAVGGILFYLTKNKRHSYEDIQTPAYVAPLSGAILLLVSFVFPAFSLASFRPGVFGTGMIVLFTFLLLGLGILGVWMFNVLGLKNKLFSIIGFLVILLMAVLPALASAPIDSTYGTLGVIYFTFGVQVMIVWSGFTLLYRYFKPQED